MSNKEEMVKMVRQDKEPLIIGETKPVEIDLVDLLNLRKALDESDLTAGDKLRAATEKVLVDVDCL